MEVTARDSPPEAPRERRHQARVRTTTCMHCDQHAGPARSPVPYSYRGQESDEHDVQGMQFCLIKLLIPRQPTTREGFARRHRYAESGAELAGDDQARGAGGEIRYDRRRHEIDK